MSANTDDTGGYEYQSTFDSLGGMEWELQAHDKKQLEKTYCEFCSRSVGNNPRFFGVGGFLTGPFCSTGCQFAWLNEADDE
jgi:hypothetical protein